MEGVLLPPSPNWYGSHVADWGPRGLYAYAAHNSVVILDARERTVKGILAGHTNRVNATAFVSHPSGRLYLVSGGADRALKLWAPRTLRLLCTVTKRSADITSIAATGDGTMAVIGDKAGGITVWELGGSAKPRKLQRTKLSSAVLCLAAPRLAEGPAAAAAADATEAEVPAGCSPGLGTAVVAGGGEGSSGLASPPDSTAADGGGSSGHRIHCRGDSSSSEPPTPSGSLVAAGCADGSVCIIDVKRDAVLCMLRRHVGEVQGLRWASALAGPLCSPMRLLVSTAADGCMHVYSFPIYTAAVSAAVVGVASRAGAPAAAETGAGGGAGAGRGAGPPLSTGAAAASSAAGPAAAAVEAVEGGSEAEGPAGGAELVGAPGEQGEAAVVAAATTAAAEVGSLPAGEGPPLEETKGGPASPVVPPEGDSAPAPTVDSMAANRCPPAQNEGQHEGDSTGGGAEGGEGAVQQQQQQQHNNNNSEEEEEEQDRAGEALGEPVFLHKLRLPLPPGSMSDSQKGRLWLAAAWLLPCCGAGAAGSGGGLAETHAWLVNTVHGGKLMAWQVPLTPGAPTPTPVRLPGAGGHSRTIFSLHAAQIAVQQHPAPTHPDESAVKGSSGKGCSTQEAPCTQTLSATGGACTSGPGQAPGAADGAGVQEPHSATAPSPPPPLSPPPMEAQPPPPPPSPQDNMPRPASSPQDNMPPPPPPESPFPSKPAPSASSTPCSHSGGGAAKEAMPPAAAAAAAATCRGVYLMTSSMDRAVLQWQLPCLGSGQGAWARTQVIWGFTGLGGEASSLSISTTQPHLLAVGCGDKSIRVLPLPPAEPGPTQAAGAGDEALAVPAAAAAEGEGLEAAGRDGAEFWDEAGAQSTATVEAAALAGIEHAQQARQAQLAQRQLLAWQGIPDKVTSVAWHPAEQGVLAFGCQDGSVGLMRAGVVAGAAQKMLPVRHKGAVLELRWSAHPPCALHSLSSDGTLLRWGPWVDARALLSVRGGKRTGSQQQQQQSPRQGQQPVDLGSMLRAAVLGVSGERRADGAWRPLVGQAAGLGSISALEVGSWGGGLEEGSEGVPAAEVAVAAAAVGDVTAVAVGCTDGSISVFRSCTAAPAPAPAPALPGAAARSAAPAGGEQLAWGPSAPHPSPVSHLALRCPGLLASAHEDGMVAVHAIWHGYPAGHARPMLCCAEMECHVTALSWQGMAHHDRLACALDDCTIMVLHYERGQLVPVAKLSGHVGIVRSLAWHPEKEEVLLSGSEDQSLRMWDTEATSHRPGAAEEEVERLAVAAAAATAAQRVLQASRSSQDACVAAAAAGLGLPADAPAAAVAVVETAVSGQQPAKTSSVQQELLDQQESGPAVQVSAAPATPTLDPGPPPADADELVAEPSKRRARTDLEQAAVPSLAVSAVQGSGTPEEGLPSVLSETSSPTAALPLAEAPTQPSAVQQAQRAATLGVAGAGGGEGRKAGVSSRRAAAGLGSRPLLPPLQQQSQQWGQGQGSPRGQSTAWDPSQQQRQQAQACLVLAGHLLAAPAVAAAAAAPNGSAGAPMRGAALQAGKAAEPATATPSMAEKLEAALLLGCSGDPLVASAALGQQAEVLAASTSTGSWQARVGMAQRSAALSLWRGDVGQALQTLLENDALTADFVSMSAAAGRAAWEAVVQVYAAKLAGEGEPHLAALHLLSVGDVHAALGVYRSAGMLREATELATARLLPEDPALLELRRAYAQQLAGRGLEEQAAAQCMAAGLWGSAAAALARRKGSPEAQAAALELCSRALHAAEGAGLEGGERGRQNGGAQAPSSRLLLPAGEVQQLRQLRRQMAEAEAAEAEAEAGLGVGAAGEGREEPGGDRGGRGRQQRRYSRETALSLASSGVEPSLVGLPPELSAAAAATPAAPAGQSLSNGVRKAGPRREVRRYSRQQLLGLAEMAHGAVAPSLPPDLAAGAACSHAVAGGDSCVERAAQKRQGALAYTREQLVGLAGAGECGAPPGLPPELAR